MNAVKPLDTIPYIDKIGYYARNNNLPTYVMQNLVHRVSDYTCEKVVRDSNIPYSISQEDTGINDVGQYFCWGLAQVPGSLFLQLKHLNFLADSVIQLIYPGKNMEVACKIIRHFRNHNGSLELAIYKYLKSDIDLYDINEDDPVFKTVTEILDK